MVTLVSLTLNFADNSNANPLVNDSKAEFAKNKNVTNYLTKNDDNEEMNSDDLVHGYHFLYGEEQLAANKEDSLRDVETPTINEGSVKFDSLDNDIETKDIKKESNYKVFNEDYQDKLMDEIFIV